MSVVGATFNHVGDPITLDTGYAVGIRSFDSLKAAFDAATPRHHVGYWVDGATGQAYYDLVTIIDEEDCAKRVGTKYDQIAIWSFGDHKEIRL